MSSIITHLKRNQYGSFTLTDAIRPGSRLSIVPKEGYRLGVYRDVYTGKTMPMLSAAVSSEKIFDVFLDLLEPLGDVVHVILESSHDGSLDSVQSNRRTEIDLPVLASHCCEFEDLVLNDGCTAVAVLANRKRMEVQFDEHKLLHVYGKRLQPFRKILGSYGIECIEDLKLICEDEHLHHSTVRYQEEYERLVDSVGAEQPARVLSDSDDNGW